MAKRHLRTHITIILTGIFIGFGLTGTRAQDTTYVDALELFEVEKVHWIGQIPPLMEDRKKDRKGWLKRLVLGEKDIISIQKPIQAIQLSRQANLARFGADPLQGSNMLGKVPL